MSDLGLHAAARRALDVLIVIRDYDQDSGVNDPDIVEAIEALEAALENRREQRRASRKRAVQEQPKHVPTNHWGFAPRERLRVLEGRFAGALARYAGVSNSTDIYIEVDNTRTTIRADHVRRMYP